MKSDSLAESVDQDAAGRVVPGVSKAGVARRRSKLAMTVAAALAGGSMLSTCETRLRDAVIAGSKDVLFSILDPNVIVDAIFGEQDAP